MPIYPNDFVPATQSSRFVAHMIRKGIEGKLAFHSEDAEKFISIAPIIDNISKRQIGEVSVVLKANRGSLGVLDVDLSLTNKPQLIHFFEPLPGSEEHHEFYQAEIDGKSGRFVAETINRYAIWDKTLENTVHKANLSAFPFRIDAYDNLDALNKDLGFTPIESSIGTITGFSEDFCMPAESKNGNSPYTYFFGKVKKIQDIEIDLGKQGLFKRETLKVSIMHVKCFAGILPMLVSREIFNFDQFTKDKILSICAVIRADLGGDPDPRATKK